MKTNELTTILNKMQRIQDALGDKASVEWEDKTSTINIRYQENNEYEPEEYWVDGDYIVLCNDFAITKQRLETLNKIMSVL